MELKPYLVQFATNRTSTSNELPGYYCNKKQMWLDQDTQRPIIEIADLAELLTKTKVKVESDDNSVYSLELMTKTNQGSERDDNDIRLSHLHQLQTKTEVRQEADDTCLDKIFWD